MEAKYRLGAAAGIVSREDAGSSLERMYAAGGVR
jgi:hypothetical protein